MASGRGLCVPGGIYGFEEENMKAYIMKFKGSILVRAEDEDEAEQLFDDAHYGLATMFDNTDEIAMHSFQYDYTSMVETYNDMEE